MQFVIPIANQHSYNSIPRNADLKLSIDNACNAPSRQLVIDWKGDCFVLDLIGNTLSVWGK